MKSEIDTDKTRTERYRNELFEIVNFKVIVLD